MPPMPLSIKISPSFPPPCRKPASNLTQSVKFPQISIPPSIWIHREQGNRHFDTFTLSGSHSSARCTLLAYKCAKSTTQSLPVGTLYTRPRHRDPPKPFPLKIPSISSKTPQKTYKYVINPQKQLTLSQFWLNSSPNLPSGLLLLLPRYYSHHQNPYSYPVCPPK